MSIDRKKTENTSKYRGFDDYDSEQRKKALLDIFKNAENMKEVIKPLIEDVVFLEDQLHQLRKLPFIRVSSQDPSFQKATPASKQYKELLQQYNNCVKILTGILRKDTPEEESPLRAFIAARKAQS